MNDMARREHLIFDKGQDFVCRPCTCLVYAATVSSAVTAWYPSHNDDNHDNDTLSDKYDSDNNKAAFRNQPNHLQTPALEQQSTQPELTSQSHRPQILNQDTNKDDDSRVDGDIN